MTPDEEIESAARALYYQDHADAGTANPTPWEQLPDGDKTIWIEAFA